MIKIRTISILFFITLLSGCIKTSKLEPVWTRDNALTVSTTAPVLSGDISIAPLLHSLQQSLLYLKKNKTPLQFGSLNVSRESLINSLEKFETFLKKGPTQSAIQSYIESNFQILQSAADSVLFTGYYTPLLHGSPVKTARYRFPLYRKPADLVSIRLEDSIKSKLPPEVPVINRGRLESGTVTIPYYSRKEIDIDQKLKGRHLELLWVDNEIDLFFLHIQGSGVVQLENGDRWYVGYEDKNGQPYIAIGKTLMDQGLLDKGNVTMFSIKEVLRKNPQIVTQVLNSNPSYCFFKKLNSSPLGSLSVPVTAEYSIATDSSLFPHGALAIIETQLPHFDDHGELAGYQPASRLLFNQDTGGAIRGAGRVDIYFGEGSRAEKSAGIMQQRGKLFFLVPKTDLKHKGM